MKIAPNMLFVGISCLSFAAVTGTAGAQGVPWVVFEDLDALGSPISSSACNVVNAANTELVVLRDTGALAIITQDGLLSLDDTFVDLFFDDQFVALGGFVSCQGEPVGMISFKDDGDNFRTVWWTGFFGEAIHLDGLSLEPSQSELFPADIPDVNCDACDILDDATTCTPPDPVLVPVDNPGTVNVFEIPIPTFNFCGANMMLSMTLTASGLALMGTRRRRR